MRKLIAKDGYLYTQANKTKLINKIFTKELYLGINDSEDNWTQITSDDAQLLISERNKIFDNEYEYNNN